MTARDVISLIAWREIRERARSRAFLYSTLFLLAMVAATAAFPAIISTETTYRVAATEPLPNGLDAALQQAAEPFDASVGLETVDSEAAARQRLDDEKVDAVLLLPSSQVVFRAEVDTQLAAIAESAVRAVRRHLPVEPELAVATLASPDSESTDAEILVAVIGSTVLLLSLAVYGQWVLVGVVEEKSNRVAELILSTTRPQHLLAGKVIGIGLLGVAQLALAAVLAIGLLVAGVFDAPVELGASVALVVPWFALGFALYAVAFATVGALASRQQDASTAGQPVALTLVAAYMAGYFAVSADADGILAHVLTVFPLTAPLVLPARSALGSVPLWEHALAAVLALVTISALVHLAGRVYAHGLLYHGTGIGARAAWRLLHQR